MKFSHNRHTKNKETVYEVITDSQEHLSAWYELKPKLQNTTLSALFSTDSEFCSIPNQVGAWENSYNRIDTIARIVYEVRTVNETYTLRFFLYKHLWLLMLMWWTKIAVSNTETLLKKKVLDTANTD